VKNFRLIKSGVNLTAIRQELRNCHLWVDLGARKNSPATHADSDRIQLRTNQSVEGVHYRDVHETIDLPAWTVLSATRQFVVDFANLTSATIGHVRVTNLRAGAQIIPHIDIGEYCAIRDRYHLAINTHGTQFTAGDETVIMQEGEFWWFDNKKLHHVRNLGDQPRTHLVFDLLPPKPCLNGFQPA
jgi:hypothetical protein